MKNVGDEESAEGEDILDQLATTMGEEDYVDYVEYEDEDTELDMEYSVGGKNC